MGGMRISDCFKVLPDQALVRRLDYQKRAVSDSKPCRSKVIVCVYP